MVRRTISFAGYPLYEITSSGLTHSCSASLLPSEICEWTLKWAQILLFLWTLKDWVNIYPNFHILLHCQFNLGWHGDMSAPQIFMYWHGDMIFFLHEFYYAWIFMRLLYLCCKCLLTWRGSKNCAYFYIFVLHNIGLADTNFWSLARTPRNCLCWHVKLSSMRIFLMCWHGNTYFLKMLMAHREITSFGTLSSFFVFFNRYIPMYYQTWGKNHRTNICTLSHLLDCPPRLCFPRILFCVI